MDGVGEPKQLKKASPEPPSDQALYLQTVEYPRCGIPKPTEAAKGFDAYCGRFSRRHNGLRKRKKGTVNITL